MFWQKKPFTYEILVPPLEKNTQKLTADEAQSLFNWYIEQIPHRIDYLSKMSNCELDLSFNSLVNLWRWFLNVAEIEKTPKAKLDEIKEQLQSKPESFIDHVISCSEKQFSLQTEYILRDIGMYVGEVFVKHSDKITWGYHTDVDKDSFANIPLLQGFVDTDFSPPFKMEFEPVHMVGVQAANLFDNSQNEKDLYNVCQIWLQKIPK